MELPGQFPYTRGPYPTMYTQKPLTIRQVSSNKNNITPCQRGDRPGVLVHNSLEAGMVTLFISLVTGKVSLVWLRGRCLVLGYMDGIVVHECREVVLVK